jgi:DNA transformation protein
MPVSPAYLDYVHEQLSAVVPITTRRMFGAVGIYSGTHFFALIDDDTLYFKVDATNRPDFEAAGMGPFDPMKDGRVMQYYKVPDHVLASDAKLKAWAAAAIEVAKRKKPSKSRRKK